MTMMALRCCSLLLCVFATLGVSFVDAATKVAVLEFGPGGAVRRTTARNAETTVNGVASFWSALNRSASRPQDAGMPVVPDMFKSADSHVVIGITGNGVDMDKMPAVSKLVTEEEKPVVGHMQVAGRNCHSLMAKVNDVEEVSHTDIVKSAKKSCDKPGFSGMKMTVDSDNASEADGEVSHLVKELESLAHQMGKTIVLNLVVEENKEDPVNLEFAARRRLDENADGENDANGGQNNQQFDGYYGYGYYNDFGEWVTIYKSMFQIQFFNVVLWTALGLVLVLFSTIYMMVYMPLEADTLLFGESAKMVGDE